MHDDPPFHVVFLFHDNIALFRQTAARCVAALIDGTEEAYELTIYCDGTPPALMGEVHELAESLGADSVVRRSRGQGVASGAEGNNAHRRLFPTRSKYLIVIEDDVAAYRTSTEFDVLASIRQLFESHPEVVVLTKLDDHEKWAWKLCDVHEPAGAVRFVNRVATHLIVYDTERFAPAAGRFGAWWSDVFVDRDDWSYNWEDLVSHVGTTGGRRIAYPSDWPLLAYHCDEKIAPDSIYNTQEPHVKLEVFRAVDALHGGAGSGQRPRLER